MTTAPVPLRQPRPRRRAALAAWVPVAGLVAALFLVPSGSRAAEAPAGPLTVTPAQGYYAGERLTFSGDVGSGVQTIRMERKQSPTSGWADVYDPTSGKVWASKTKADGSFSFTFPAFAMNGLYVRVVGKTGMTQPKLFEAGFQDAEIDFLEVSPAPVFELPRGFGVVGEQVTIRAQAVARTIGGAQPGVLTGRRITIQQRNSSLGWDDVADGVIDAQGFFSFTLTPAATARVVYRARLDNWGEDGDRIGWFPGFPTLLTVVERPLPVVALAAVPTHEDVTLQWTTPATAPANIEVYRYKNAETPLRPNKDLLATLSGSATSYVDQDVQSQRTYRYALFSVSSDGVRTRLPQEIETTTLAPPPPPDPDPDPDPDPQPRGGAR